MKIREIFRKLYMNTWIRLPTKFVLSFVGLKTAWDYQQYLTKWRAKKAQPRFCEFDVQSPTAPPLPFPYPFYSDYEHMQDMKRWFRVNNDTLKAFCSQMDRRFVYVDHPYRENINAIDQLIIRAKQFSCSENFKFYTINEYAQKQESIPQGVFQEIRQIHQPQLEINAPIIPKL